MPNIVSLDRLKSQLLTSGLSQTNQPLFQVINQLIDYIRQNINETEEQIQSVSAGVTNNNTIIQSTKQILMPMPIDDDHHYNHNPIAYASFLSRNPLPGEVIDVPYNAANFTASAGTWTVDAGDILAFSYSIINRMMQVFWTLNGTSVSAGAPVSLQIAVPGGYVAKTQAVGICRALDNGVERMGICDVAVGTSTIRLFAISFATAAGVGWAASVNNTAVQGNLMFRV